MEDFDPLQPVNTVVVGEEPEPEPTPAPAPAPAPEPEPDEDEDADRWHGLVGSTWLRILKRYRNDYAGAAKAGRLAALALEVRQYGVEQFEPIATAMRRDGQGGAMFDLGWPADVNPSAWNVEELASQCAAASVGV